MHVCLDVRKVDFQPFDKPVVTLGTFDGVHLGHQAIIRRLIGKSTEEKTLGVVATYEPHPQSVVSPQTAPQTLTTLEEKLKLLEELGVEETVVINFDRRLREYPAERFVREILVKKLNVGHLVVGDDHAFGKDRAGKINLLKDVASEYDFTLEVVPALEADGARISSTRIRIELKAGDFAKARAMMGHSYPVSGAVVRGKGRGRSLDYPTLNMNVHPRKLLPQDGVYSVRAELKGKNYAGMLYIGPKPTFEDTARSVEVHLFGFKEDVGDLRMQIWIEGWLRKPERFGDPEHLRTQLRSDEKRIKEMLKIDRSNSIKKA